MATTAPAIGDLRERVMIQRTTNTRDSVGGIIQSWATVATVWASVEPMSAGEQFRRQQVQAKADWRVTIRYRNDILPADRITWRERVFQVRGLTADERRRFLAISCEELQTAPTAGVRFFP